MYCQDVHGATCNLLIIVNMFAIIVIISVSVIISSSIVIKLVGVEFVMVVNHDEPWLSGHGA